jgi:hypothetical protein
MAKSLYKKFENLIKEQKDKEELIKIKKREEIIQNLGPATTLNGGILNNNNILP